MFFCTWNNLNLFLYLVFFILLHIVNILPVGRLTIITAFPGHSVVHCNLPFGHCSFWIIYWFVWRTFKGRDSQGKERGKCTELLHPFRAHDIFTYLELGCLFWFWPLAVYCDVPSRVCTGCLRIDSYGFYFHLKGTHLLQSFSVFTVKEFSRKL